MGIPAKCTWAMGTPPLRPVRKAHLRCRAWRMGFPRSRFPQVRKVVFSWVGRPCSVEPSGRSCRSCRSRWVHGRNSAFLSASQNFADGRFPVFELASPQIATGVHGEGYTRKIYRCPIARHVSSCRVIWVMASEASHIAWLALIFGGKPCIPLLWRGGPFNSRSPFLGESCRIHTQRAR